jgi:hypothetical protein
MPEPGRLPPWNDPLGPPPVRPDGTGSEAYVVAPEPRPNPMTIEGEIAAFGLFAQKAKHARGWQGVAARALVWWVLVGMALGFVWVLVAEFSSH